MLGGEDGGRETSKEATATRQGRDAGAWDGVGGAVRCGEPKVCLFYFLIFKIKFFFFFTF